MQHCIVHLPEELVELLGSHEDFHLVVVLCLTEMYLKLSKNTFSLETTNSLKYLGLLVSENNSGIKLSQNDYIENLKAVEVPWNKNSEEKLTKEEMS